MDEAVALAMEQNLGIQIQRFDPQIQDTGISLAQAQWRPNFSTHADAPVADAGVDQLARRAARRASTTAPSRPASASTQMLPWGGSYTATWNSPRLHDHEPVQQLQPAAQLEPERCSTRSRCCATSRSTRSGSRWRPARNRATCPTSSSRASSPQTLRNVRNAYWDLAYAHRQPEGAAGVAGAVAAVAEGQPEARGDRHDGADRHRAGAGRGRDQRVERHRRRGGDQAGAGQPARADSRTRDARLLDGRVRADRRAGVRRTRPIDVDAAVRNALDKRSDLRSAKNSHGAERHQHQVLRATRSSRTSTRTSATTRSASAAAS